MTNTGDRAGKEVIQLYIAPPVKKSVRPVRELRAFNLEPGECRTVEFVLEKRGFAEWNKELHRWDVPDGIYRIQIGKSAAEIVLETEIEVKAACHSKPQFTLNTPLGDIMEHPEAKTVLLSAMQEMLGSRASRLNSEDAADKSGALSREAMLASAAAMPLRALISFGADTSRKTLEVLLEKINQDC